MSTTYRRETAHRIDASTGAVQQRRKMAPDVAAL